uniref:C-type lectin domain-containing protein n=1 Tax=Panagrolaimus sp. ES5 TaxID=591445 RepID=A0AC34F603_9BILA
MAGAIIVLSFLFLNLPVIAKSDCPANTVSWHSQCFSFYSNSTGFADAELTCNNQSGGHLVSIHDGFTNALVTQQATKHFHERSEVDFWIGATNLMTQKQWNWTDGTPLDYNNWNKGEPQNALGSGCVTVSINDGTWSSKDCFKSKPFVCATSAAPTYPLYVNCSSGWSYFQPTHSCYGVNAGGHAKDTNWTAAQKYCEDLNAQLPSIHSYAELQFIKMFVYTAWSDYWLGIYSTDGRNWKGPDGINTDFLKYGKWCSGSPSNITGERCVAVGECYYDVNCLTTLKHTLCKKSIQ